MTIFAQEIITDLINMLRRLCLPGASPDDLEQAADQIERGADILREIARNQRQEKGNA